MMFLQYAKNVENSLNIEIGKYTFRMKTIVLKEDTYKVLKEYKERIGAKSMDEAVRHALTEASKAKIIKIREYRGRFKLDEEKLKKLIEHIEETHSKRYIEK